MTVVASIRPNDPPPLRTPPHNFEAEQALLGALLANNRAYERVAEIVRAEHFADERHGRIYEAIGKLIELGTDANPITLKRHLEQAGQFEGLDASYLASLARAAISVVNVKDYAAEIFDCWLKRQLIAHLNEAIDRAHDSQLQTAARDLIEEVETKLYGLAETGRSEREVMTLGAAAGEMMRLADEAGKRGGGLVGITTGFVDLDKATGGFEPGNLYVLGARPSMGKTALALWGAWGTARAGNRVLYFSLEMSGVQLARRIAAGLCGIAIHDVKVGSLSDNDWQRLVAAEQDLRKLPILVDDTPSISLTALRNLARRVKRRGGLGLIIVDHLQLMRLGERVENRRLEIGAISAGLKRLAKELEVPILALSQLSRAVEGRDEKRPTLSDLRESGDIEQDADAVMFLYREHYYVEREKPSRRTGESHDKFDARMADWDQRLRDSRGKAEVIIAKQRDGGVGTVELAFDDRLARFQNLHRGPNG